jgi:flagellum-specific peptidoglycan hydrolase FlgJ
MTPKAFAARYKPAAVLASKATGVLPGVILAQWAHETGWGTSVLARKCDNMAGIRFYGHKGTTNRGGFACYRSMAGFVADYVHTLKLPYYLKVRRAKGALAQISALGKSPWSASHYGKPPGANLIGPYHLIAKYL